MWGDLKKIPIIKPVQAPQPTAITRTLKSFQLEGLDWMMKQEKTHYKGGLLGDEMGMGKTIQAVSLIMSDFPVKAPSLVLVPPVALMQWQNEINSYTNNTLKVLVVHGSNSKSKNLTVNMIKTYNVVLMSYNSLESMFRKQEKGWARGEDLVKEESPIHAVKWHRVILDEAHSIKTRTTGSARACFALKGSFKWCLSGTPVQNRIGEFFSLLRFLNVRPFADYFCERCDCAELHWMVDESYRCKKCKHSASEHRSVFNEEILNPIIEGRGNREEALDKLHLITDRIMLRRMKKDHTSSMELPPKLVHVRNEFFSTVERDFATSVMSNTTREFDTYVSRGVVLNNYANIFGLLMMMRQVANHPDLILKKNAEGGQNVLVCNICDEAAEDAIRSKCKHEFCRSCVKTYINSNEQSGNAIDCPRCHIVSLRHLLYCVH
jgi:DNA repair protein RAD16